MVGYAYEVAKELEEKDIGVEVLNIRFLKPIDKESVIKSAIKTKKVITIEDGYIKGGLSTSVDELLTKQKEKFKIINMGYPDKFIKQGTIKEIEREYNMDKESIKNNILKIIKKDRKEKNDNN